MSFTNGNEAAGDSNRFTGDGVPTTVSSIPLTDLHDPQTASIGTLVRDATAQISTLFRAEVELAKAEVTREAKKGLQGSAFLVLALAVLTFSAFFFFFFLAELLSVWLDRWASFLIVFALMLVVTGVLALLGYARFRRLHAPTKTIDSIKQTATVLPGQRPDATSPTGTGETTAG
ncbi:phage holin family protein [Rhodococcus xishaensis]|uniref:Phage holin family protein n=1 Tax=Rhodococcus xishaensis TaxID=2487364 RepID=A0A3S3AH01_9NOCA|nr:phage holin family protein [Rhodococcus xishaensis]RVW00269.1 phage holin family protein [Rhodococcus xishaensis]